MPPEHPLAGRHGVQPLDSTDQKLQAESQQAAADLQRVISEHPGTPWAVVAERELAVPPGWEWQRAARDSDSD
jgi:hypothetical protein